MTYLSTILADAPLHYWRLADGAGCIAHDIGSSPVHLTQALSARPDFGYSGISADGGAAYFDSGMSIFHNATIHMPIPCTVELWFWPDIVTTALQFLVAWDGASAGAMDIVLRATGLAAADWGASSSVSAAAPTAQAWHHLVAVETGAAVTMYLDSLVRPAGAAAIAAANFNLYLGRNQPATQFFTGAMCEVAVYGAALTAAQVTAHFLAQEQSGPPISNQAGPFGAGGGSGTPSNASLTEILNAVRKTY